MFLQVKVFCVLAALVLGTAGPAYAGVDVATQVVKVSNRPAVDDVFTVEVDYTTVTGTSRTVTTLQVVSNPILDRTFTFDNGTVIKNPIHQQAWQSLANLGADLVRFVPWFPYPHKSVAELDAPTKFGTSWDFSEIIPQLYDFMAATYGHGHSTVINFSTQPCWLFKNKDCSYPKNPDQSFFDYVRGSRDDLIDPTAKTMAGYYARLMAWLVKGEFTDEAGVKHTGGPKYDLSRKNGHTWELFNEAEHGYTVEQYTHDYDVIVPAMIEAAGGEDHAPAFMGIGGASPDWIPYFLNSSKHVSPSPPIDYVSLHFYGGCTNRTDPETYSQGFFSSALAFVKNVKVYLDQIKATDYPEVGLDLDELGVIMPDDNNPNFGEDASLPDIYWNAAGAMYAYLFAQLAPMGVRVLGHSQLAGSPKMPQWNIPLPQYPSVSLLDWRTGYGNARYWTLKLLIEQFKAGDKFVKTSAKVLHPLGACERTQPVDTICATVDGPSYGSVEISCCEAGSVIEKVQFADWGTPSGSCGSYKSDSKCTADPAKVAAWANAQCVGKTSCTLLPWPALGDPCDGTTKQLVVQTTCSSSGKGVANSKMIFPEVVAQGIVTTKGHSKLLLINTQNTVQSVSLSPDSSRKCSGKLAIVDPKSVQAAAANGIREETFSTCRIDLEPFAVVVAQLDQAESPATHLAQFLQSRRHIPVHEE